MNFTQTKRCCLFVDACNIDIIARLVKCVLLSIVAHIVVLHFLKWNVLTGVSDSFQSAIVVQATLTPMLVPITLKHEVLPAINTQAFLSEAIATTVEKQSVDFVRQAANGDAFQSFFPATQLTRLPFPITEIDLNADNIDEVAVGGQIELSILIDEAGRVVDVSVREGGAESPVFAERVARRFFDSKFSPGEINGQRVRSQLLISVISEPRSSVERF
jgi:hypothetical protein